MNDTTQHDVTPKLRKPYIGPYLVLQKYSDLDYVIQFDATGKKRVIHHNRLKPYEGTDKLSWATSALKRAQKEGVRL